MAQEAADWLTHYKALGKVPGYWEIGNEVYIVGSSWSSMQQQKTPSQYAAIFDAYAQALRSVDPSVKVGMLGCHDSGAFNLCADPSWNKTVLGGVTQKADFLSVHNSYAPAALYQADLAGAMRATLAAPDYVAANFALVEQDLAQYGGSNANLGIAVTAHASFFVPSGQSTDLEWMTMNETLGAALFSAAEYDVFLADPRIVIVNHINPIASIWQAMVATSQLDGVSLPTVSAFGLVFRLYADAAGGAFVPATIQRSPMFDAPQVGIVPQLSGVSVLHGVAAIAKSGDRLWLYVVNRDLATDVTARVVVGGLPWASRVTSVTADVVNGPSWNAVNQPGAASPVARVTSMLAPAGALDVTFPAHSLTRLTFQ
jgi:alpha-L-arabinofuranosidase